jgi:hypothetical protein
METGLCIHCGSGDWLLESIARFFGFTVLVGGPLAILALVLAFTTRRRSPGLWPSGARRPARVAFALQSVATVVAPAAVVAVFLSPPYHPSSQSWGSLFALASLLLGLPGLAAWRYVLRRVEPETWPRVVPSGPDVEGVP